ncbi:MAG: Bifunctional metallophosphatase/5'-nucleotidase [Candidatus Thorarchaeota archaeon]|nr:MAG: Bifunctional metallophosphatase/5'-nucleotidase [Candidatus Thorarchaeota archaeon]
MLVDSRNLTLLQINDSHAYIEPHNEYFWNGEELVIREAGGYARIAELVKTIRDEKKNQVLFLDNGDTIHGTYPAVTSHGEAMVPILNRMGIDGMTLHWEFAYGPEQLKKISKMIDYPFLACNTYNEEDGKLVYPAYEVYERNDMRIGVIGIANRIVDVTMPVQFSRGVKITKGVDELPDHIRTLREKERVDLVVVLSHLGLPHANYIAEHIDGIDVFLSGHTHNRLYMPFVVNNTIIIQSGYQGSFIGRLDLSIRDKKIVGFKHDLIEINENIPDDPEVREEVTKVMEPHREMLHEVVGETKTPLARHRVMESTMDNFLLQGLINTSDAELAFSNGWRYGAPIPKGNITMEDLWNIIPVNPPVSVCSITGEELLVMMEENLEATFSRDPFGQMGGYVKRCLGLHIYFKIENPKGRRIQDFFIGKERLDRKKTYQACFVTTQGIPERYGSERRDLDIDAIEALRLFLDEKKSVKANLRNAIVAI